MNKNIRFINNFTLLLFKYYLLIDSITGITLQALGISFSIPYKLLLVFLMMISIAGFSLDKITEMTSILLILVFSVILYIWMDFSQTYLAIQNYMKYFTQIIYYMYFKMIKDFDDYDKDISQIITINSIVFFINIFLGKLGFGYSTYINGVGIKGFFYSGNEIFLILLSITGFFLLFSRRNLFLLYIISFSLAFFIGTKTAMLTLLIILCFDFYINLSYPKKKLVLAFTPLIILICFLIFVFFIQKLEVVKNAISNFKTIKTASNSGLNAILSGRLVFLKNNILNWYNDLTFPKFLFGGYSFINEKTIEIDFFDALFLNGVLITVIMLFFYLFLIFQAFHYKKYLLCVINVLVLIISFMAGHIWYNLSGGLFYILLNVYTYKNTFCYTQNNNLKFFFKKAELNKEKILNMN